jgi:hypothetical protein
MSDKPTSDVLASCPFCNGDALRSETPRGYRVECSNRWQGCPMNMRTHHRLTQEAADAAWDTRPAQDCARCADLEAALEAYEAATRALPIGHEDKTKGASSYNWRMACLQEIRARAARGKDTP